MPEVNEILHAYGLSTGASVGGCKILNSTGVHTTVVRYHDYTYTFTLTLECTNPGNVASYLNSMTQNQKVINSRYGNPYMCVIGPWTVLSSNGHITAQANGHSYRLR